MNNNISNSKHKMSKIWIIIILVVVMILGCCSCGAFYAIFKGFMNAKNNDDANNTSAVDEEKTSLENKIDDYEENTSYSSTKAEETTKADLKVDGKQYVLTPLSSPDFDEGYLFLGMLNKDYSSGIQNSIRYYGCFDTNGELIYCTEQAGVVSYVFEKGYTQLLKTSQQNNACRKWICINPNGEVEFTYEEQTGENGIESKIIDVCSNYLLVREHQIGFTDNYLYTYKLIYRTGEVVLEYQDHEYISPMYLGNNVFYFDSANAVNPMGGEHDRLLVYNAEKRKFFESVVNADYKSFAGTNHSYDSGFVFASHYLSLSDGTFFDFNSLGDGNYTDVKYVDKEHVICYETKKNQYYLLNIPKVQAYDCLSALNGHNYWYESFDSNILFLIEGDDSCIYYMIIDGEGNTIQELTQLPDSYSSFKNKSVVQKDGIIEISYYRVYAGDEIKKFYHDLSSNKNSLTGIIEPDNMLIFHNGWSYISDMNNWINTQGEYLFSSNEDDFPAVIINDSELKIINEETTNSNDKTTSINEEHPINNQTVNSSNPYSGFFGSENTPADMEFYDDSDIKRGVVETESTSLNLRSGPGTDFEVADEIPKGASVEVLGTNNEWCYIRWYTFRENPMGGGNSIAIYGYVSSKYISISE